MLDRTIEFKNIIMRCDCIKNIEDIKLPIGYNFKTFEIGDEKQWARLEYKVGDFDTINEAIDYFKMNYMNDIDEIKKRCILVVNKNNQIVSSCIAWKDKKDDKDVASLHWLITDETCQNRGIGTATLLKTLQTFKKLGEIPVYIHTQPWSYKAIYLYNKYGFKITKKDYFASYENQFDEAIKILENLFDKSKMQEIKTNIESR